MIRRYLPLVALLFTTRLLAAEPAKPNIVFFIADDLSRLDSTVYGATDVQTPAMERLARDGLTFDRCFVASPSCAPSRGAMLTGLMPVRNGAEPNHAEPRKEIKKLPAYLQELGYEVVAFGKVAHYEQTKDYGFDYCAHNSFHDDAAVGAALEWLRARKSTKPLALFVGTNWPHVPWPKEAKDFDPAKIKVPVTNVDTEETRKWRARYYQAIKTFDTELGEVYDLAREKLGQDTFFLQSSDNGAQWPFGKWNLYDAGVRMPLIVVWPGHIQAGRRTDAMVSWLDILPTLVDVAGGPAPQGLDGSTMLPVLLGKTDTFRDRIFTTHSNDQRWNVYPARSLRTADWKYIHNLYPNFYFTSHVDLAKPVDGSSYFASWVEKAKTDPAAAAIVHHYHVRTAEELYDLRNDPNELHNLADDPAQAPRLAAMRAEVDAWMKANHDEGKVYAQPRLISDPHRADPPRPAAAKKKAKPQAE